jgi:PAS domain S-box-containing protein
MASEPCFVVIIRDITEQKKAQAELREHEARINLAAESANLALWVYDPEKNLAWMSEKGRAIYGFGSKEALSRDSFVSCVHPDERQVVRNAFDRARESQETFEIEHRILRPDGETGWVIMRGRSLCDEHGKPLELIGVTIDVTAKKQADLQLQVHRQEMAHLSRVAMMGEMAASLAHELNQPLSGIISNARAGERFIDRGDVDLRELSNLLADIVADGRRAGDVIRGIRSMIRKDAPARQRVNLNDLVMNVVHMVKPDAMHHCCELETLLEPNLLALEADPIQLQQVLINLVINAFDAMRDTPLNRRKVVIATERNGDGAIRTSVRDYGVGISEEAHGQLFDHFFTTKPEGLGMGLGLVRSIVESHGGTVAAENVEGEGAEFHFILPASAAAL